MKNILITVTYHSRKGNRIQVYHNIKPKEVKKTLNHLKETFERTQIARNCDSLAKDSFDNVTSSDVCRVG